MKAETESRNTQNTFFSVRVEQVISRYILSSAPEAWRGYNSPGNLGKRYLHISPRNLSPLSGSPNDHRTNSSSNTFEGVGRKNRKNLVDKRNRLRVIGLSQTIIKIQ